MKSEDEIQQLIQAEAAKYGIILLRNNSGALNDMTGRPVRFGLGNISKEINENFKSSDLIGIYPLVVTQSMVGMTVGVFMACEVKEEAWNPNKKLDKRETAQNNFNTWVRKLGGFAGFANSVESFKKIIGK